MQIDFIVNLRGLDPSKISLYVSNSSKCIPTKFRIILEQYHFYLTQLEAKKNLNQNKKKNG